MLDLKAVLSIQADPLISKKPKSHRSEQPHLNHLFTYALYYQFIDFV